MERPKSAPNPEPIAPPGWPERIIFLAQQWKSPATSPAQKEGAFADLWGLTRSAVGKYLRLHAGRNQRISKEDLQDLASQKALDLLRSLVGGKWEPTSTSPAQLCSFISTLSRNAVVDFLRTHGSRQWTELDAVQDRRSLDQKVHGNWKQEAPELQVQREEFARALRDCAATLRERARRIWFFRVFYDMPSKEIASHRGVRMQVGAVDMTLARCREKISMCMGRKGFESHSMPPGTFATLWEVFGRSEGDFDE